MAMLSDKTVIRNKIVSLMEDEGNLSCLKYSCVQVRWETRERAFVTQRISLGLKQVEGKSDCCTLK